MLKKVRSKIRRRKVKKVLKRHGSEVLAGVVMGLLTDILTDIGAAHLRPKITKKFR